MGEETHAGREPDEPDPSSLPLCAECGEPVGVLEAAWLEGPDGTLRPASVLNMDAAARSGAYLVYHAGCLTPAPDDA
jgi:hypothetical protein